MAKNLVRIMAQWWSTGIQTLFALRVTDMNNIENRLSDMDSIVYEFPFFRKSPL